MKPTASPQAAQQPLPPTQVEASLTAQQLGKQLSRLQLGFLPAALEVEAAPPAPFSRILLWAISLLLLLAIFWACWGNIDITASAQGKLIPDGQVKVIQPLHTGVVQHIHVRDGQRVEAGMPLITLDNTTAQAEFFRLQQQQLTLAEDRARYRQLALWLQHSEAALQQEFGPAQQQALTSSWQEYLARQAAVKSQQEKLQAEKNTTLLTIRRIENSLPLIHEQADSVKQLAAQSLASRHQYLELELSRMSQVDSLAIEQARLAQLDAAIAESQQQQQLLKAEFERQIADALNQLQREQEALTQELVKAELLTRQQVLLAPEAGVIEQLAVSTMGGVVTSAQPLMRLVPLQQELIVEAWLLNKDIGFVEVGQVAEVKLESFEFTKYGVIDAIVTDISTDAVELEGIGLVYPIKVQLKQHSIRAGNKTVPLSSGMAATVEVKTGQRRIIEFLLSPIIRAVDEGVRER